MDSKGHADSRYHKHTLSVGSAFGTIAEEDDSNSSRRAHREKETRQQEEENEHSDDRTASPPSESSRVNSIYGRSEDLFGSLGSIPLFQLVEFENAEEVTVRYLQ